MPKDTPSMAKNKIRRCLFALLDPHPSNSDVAQLWDYFGSSCAYCGCVMDRSSRIGHLDHVISSALGGKNCIYNHVLACAVCNGDEKRDLPWQMFLNQKVPDVSLASERKARIDAWLERAGGIDSAKSDLMVQAQAIIAGVLTNFDDAVSKIRALRKPDV